MTMTQGSPEWRALRAGKVTASRVADLIAKTKSGWGAGRANYAAELIAERLTGVPAEGFQSAAMKFGTETEPEARTTYEMWTDTAVQEVAFVSHPTIADAGCSPDGLVGDDGIIEIKCPQSATHIDTLLGDPIPQKYITQMMFQMACTGRQWCDWVSYDPRLPVYMRLFIKRVPRDNALIAELEREVVTFLGEVSKKIEGLNRKFVAEKPVAVLAKSNLDDIPDFLDRRRNAASAQLEDTWTP